MEKQLVVPPPFFSIPETDAKDKWLPDAKLICMLYVLLQEL